MKHYYLLFLLCGLHLSAQVKIGANPTQIHNSAELEIESTGKGFLPPRMSAEQRNAIVDPAAGLVVYNTSSNCLNFFNGTAWMETCGNPEIVYQACALRINNDTALWEIVDNAGHSPINITTVGNETGNSTYNFFIQYPQIGFVGGLTATIDNGYAARGLFVGASVGTAQARIRITKQGYNIRVDSSGSAFLVMPDEKNVVFPQNFTFSFDGTTGHLTVSHPALKMEVGDDVYLSLYNNSPLTPVLVSKTNTAFVVKFKDASGNDVTVQNDDMKFQVNRTGIFKVPNENLVSLPAPQGAGNIWILGLHKKP